MKLMLLALLGVSLSAVALRAEPQPGDVFREYVWADKGKWQRITSPDATAPGAKAFLPNAVNTIDLADLAGATRVEVQLELLQSHHGTLGQALRMNGGEWIPIPASKLIPGNAGREPGVPEAWLSMREPVVELPLAAVKAGKNSFEFTCRPGVGLGAKWPQSLVYGVIFRVYYGASKVAPTGRVSATTGTPNRFSVIELLADPIAPVGGTIARVDFVARYLGYDWRGEGVQERWHYQTHFGEKRRHAGSAFIAPWKIAWDVRDVPAQEKPVQIAARIEDGTGLCRMTEAFTLEKFRGMPHVKIFAAHAVPPRWQTRAGRRESCKITLPDDLGTLREAKLILASWSGAHADEIGINGTLLVRNIGFDHDLSYDEITLPVAALRPGENEFYTKSATLHHGIEVLWPGAVIIARFAPKAAVH